jgi:small-conductance mechanosensitive channel
MKTRTWIAAATLIGLVAVTAVGVYWTREPTAATEAAATSKRKGPSPQTRQVDQKPLQTARHLSALAVTAEEQALARQAVRLANHEVDLAFAEALRQAVEEAPPLSPEAKAFLVEKTQAETAVAEDQRQIKQFALQAGQASGSKKTGLEDRLEMLKARLELDQDELEEAAEKLEQAGGDPQARIRRLKAAREAADQTTTQVPEASRQPSQMGIGGSVLARYRAWSFERNKRAQLFQAQQDSQAKILRLTQRQESVAKRLQQDKDTRAAIKEQASSGEQSSETLATLRHLTQVQHRLTSFLKRIQDQRGLGEVYGAWSTLAWNYERMALHSLLRGLLALLLVALVAFALSLGVDRLFHSKAQEELRDSTLRTVVRFCIHLTATLIVLFAILGIPTQTTTILGLAGAGLTVALKDFIVAFFGWFVLMGRNGIRVGDWVEIRGVGGEVVEIGLLRTVLLETGSWSDSGHPTGRRVAFVNNFAMEGHFFNFSTSGQWMWDDLRVMILPGQDPYPIIDGVQKLVEERTRANITLAEKEWQGSTSRYRVKSFSASPGIQVVPTSFGLEIHVRYITRAYERHDTRMELYQAVVELMHGKNGAPPATTDPAPA